MSNIFSKLITRLVAVIVIIGFISYFRESILTDDGVSTAFGGLMGTLPFAKQVADIICKILKYQIQIKIVTSATLIEDFLKLAVMACIQSPVVGLLSVIFLRVPGGTIDAQEIYMDRLGYQLRKMILTIISAPLIALAAAGIATAISDYLTANYGAWMSTLLGIGAVIFVSAISLIPLLIARVALGTAILWRILVTLLGKMATTMGVNVCCIWLYISLAGGLHSQAFTAVLSLIVWLVIMDVGMQLLRRSIVSW